MSLIVLTVSFAVIVAIIITTAIYWCTETKTSGRTKTERFEEAGPALVKDLTVSAETPFDGIPKPNESLDNEQYRAIDYTTTPQVPGSLLSRDTNTVKDLLPKDAENSLWARNSPSPQGDVSDQNYLTAASLVGINTQGSSMRNANLQIRPDPPITRAFTGIWNQSTIEPDLSRKDL